MASSEDKGMIGKMPIKCIVKTENDEIAFGKSPIKKIKLPLYIKILFEF